MLECGIAHFPRKCKFVIHSKLKYWEIWCVFYMCTIKLDETIFNQAKCAVNWNIDRLFTNLFDLNKIQDSPSTFRQTVIFILFDINTLKWQISMVTCMHSNFGRKIRSMQKNWVCSALYCGPQSAVAILLGWMWDDDDKRQTSAAVLSVHTDHKIDFLLSSLTSVVSYWASTNRPTDKSMIHDCLALCRAVISADRLAAMAGSAIANRNCCVEQYFPSKCVFCCCVFLLSLSSWMVDGRPQPHTWLALHVSNGSIHKRFWVKCTINHRIILMQCHDEISIHFPAATKQKSERSSERILFT